MRMDVWIEGHEAPVGLLERREDHALTFAYVDGAGPAQRLSLALPARSEPYADAACRGYFANLLFEGPQLEKCPPSAPLGQFGVIAQRRVCGSS